MRRVVVDPSADVRADIAKTVAQAFALETLADSEKQQAAELFAALARDVEIGVREALAEHLKHCSFLPSSLARTLAQDVESVALPVIRYSEVLSEEDLLEIIAAGHTNKQITVAERDNLSTTLTDALIDTDHAEVVKTVVGNASADISELGFHKVVTNFAEDDEIHAKLVERPKLPVNVTERLIGLVSDELKQNLMTRHELPEAMADEVTRLGHERSLVRVLLRDSRVGAIEDLVDRLRAKGSLTPTLMLRALCEGDVHFFELAMAGAADLPLEKARALLTDKGSLGLRTIYPRAGLPDTLFAAFRTVINIVYHEATSEVGGEQITRRIVNGLVDAYDDTCPTDIEHLLSILSYRTGKAA